MNTLIRTKIFEEFAKSNEKGIIFTGCFDFGSELEQDKADFDRWVEPFDKKYVIELEADLEERLRRNKTENRLEHKASKRDLVWSEKNLLKSLEEQKLNSNPGQGEKLFKNYMKINNTNKSAEEVAKMIKKKFNL